MYYCISLLECLFMRKITELKQANNCSINQIFQKLFNVLSYLSNSLKFILFNWSILRYSLLFYIKKKYQNFIIP